MHFTYRSGLKIVTVLFYFYTSMTMSATYFEGTLERRAELGFKPYIEGEKLIVSKLVKESIAETAGLRDKDTIISINSIPVSRDLLKEKYRLLRHSGGEKLIIEVMRDKNLKSFQFKPDNKQLEKIEGIDNFYNVIDISNDIRLRSIVSIPTKSKNKNTNQIIKRPAIFFVQWVSCGSVEYLKNNLGGDFAKLVKQSGRALIRVERSTSGDSLGKPCHLLDYNAELEHYFQAFLKLRLDPHIDSSNIIIYGSSLGSTIAPLLAEKLINNNIPIAGVMIQGGGAVTYLERMINFERHYMERRTSIETNIIHEQMINRIRFQVEYLANSRHPDSIAKDSKAMKTIRNDILGMSKANHYGRPFSWHQQAAEHNFLKAWKRIKSPVLVVFNEFDQFESEHGHKMIVDFINRWRPNTATFIKQTGIGHGNYAYTTTEKAYQFTKGVDMTDKLLNHMTNWLKEIK